MNELTVEDLAAWRKARHPFVLLDVRNAEELQLASIDGAVHIPMREVPHRLHELDPDADIAVLCHHGGRSEAVAHYLRANGFRSVHNVDGGIDAYARRVDASVGTY